ncbi:MAG TPA: Tad domain-containing protein [Enteractinococcus sp.]
MSRDFRDDEAGQTSVFIIGVTVVLLLFALTIAAIMSVTLQHRKLLSLADSAAQSAATSFTVDSPEELSLTINSETARRQVTQHLADVDGAERFPNLRVESVMVVDDTTVNVRLSATAHPPIVTWVLPSGVQVIADSTARTQLQQ